jgi:amidohydrolase
MSDAHLWEALERHLPAAAELRRAVHRRPELSGDEGGTRDLVLEALPAATRVTKVADTGAVVRIGGAGPAVGIRGELDALPVDETTGAPWASEHPGVAHACGHDVHLAALVAVARTVAEAGLPTPLLAVLQPREETYPSGAKDITHDAVLQEEGLAAMVGAHVQPTLPAGVVSCVPDGVNASSDEFEVVVHGTSGHAAYPHLTSDPLLALAQVVVALQSIVSRSVDPLTSAVVGVSSLSAGSAANVIPGTARATGTIRAMTEENRSLLQERVRSISQHVARAHGCEAEVAVTDGEPVLHNDPVLVAAVADHLGEQGIEVSSTLRSLGSDDFSYYSELVPSVMLFVGSDSDVPLHSASFLPTDADLRRTARAMLAGYLGAARLVHPSPPSPHSRERGTS